MKYLISLMVIQIFLISSAQAANPLTTKVKGLGVFTGQIRRVGEPVNTPSRLTITLKCENGKSITLINNQSACAVNKIEASKNELRIHHLEYDPNSGACKEPFIEKYQINSPCL